MKLPGRSGTAALEAERERLIGTLQAARKKVEKAEAEHEAGLAALEADEEQLARDDGLNDLAESEYAKRRSAIEARRLALFDAITRATAAAEAVRGRGIEVSEEIGAARVGEAAKAAQAAAQRVQELAAELQKAQSSSAELEEHAEVAKVAARELSMPFSSDPHAVERYKAACLRQAMFYVSRWPTGEAALKVPLHLKPFLAEARKRLGLEEAEKRERRREGAVESWMRGTSMTREQAEKAALQSDDDPHNIVPLGGSFARGPL